MGERKNKSNMDPDDVTLVSDAAPKSLSRRSGKKHHRQHESGIYFGIPVFFCVLIEKYI